MAILVKVLAKYSLYDEIKSNEILFKIAILVCVSFL